MPPLSHSRERGGVERLRSSAADASSAPRNKKGKDGKTSVKRAIELWSENSLELHRFHLKRVSSGLIATRSRDGYKRNAYFLSRARYDKSRLSDARYQRAPVIRVAVNNEGWIPFPSPSPPCPLAPISSVMVVETRREVFLVVLHTCVRKDFNSGFLASQIRNICCARPACTGLVCRVNPRAVGTSTSDTTRFPL